MGETRNSGTAHSLYNVCHVWSVSIPKPEPCSHPTEGSPRRCIFTGKGLNGVKRDQKLHLWNLWRPLPLPPSLLPFSLLPPHSFLTFLPPLSSSLPLCLPPSPYPSSLLNSQRIPPCLLASSCLPFGFVFLFCFIFEGSSVLNVLKLIVKYSRRFLGLGLANLDFSADRPFWFFLTKENQIFCIP